MRKLMMIYHHDEQFLYIVMLVAVGLCHVTRLGCLMRQVNFVPTHYK